MNKNSPQSLFIKHSGIQLLSTGYIGAVSLGITILLARILGVKEFGRYQYALTIATFYALLQDGGFRTLIFRERGAQTPEIAAYLKKLFSTQTSEYELLINLSLAHLILTTLFGMVIISFFPQRLLFALAFIYYGLFVLSNWLSAYLKGKGYFILDALWQATFRTTTAITIVFFIIAIHYQIFIPELPSSEHIFLASIIGAVIAFVFFVKNKALKLIHTIKFLSVNSNAILNHFFAIYRFSLPFLVIDFFTTIYFRSDLIIIGYLRSYKEAGLYAAAYRLIEGAIFITTPIMHILFQRLRLLWTDKMQFRKVFYRALIVTIFVSIVILGIGWGFSTTIIDIIYGATFTNAELLLKYLFLALFFILPNYLLTQATIALNKERFYAWTTSILALLNVALNLWLVPSLGAKGAAISTIITEACLFITLGIKVRSYLAVRGV